MTYEPDATTHRICVEREEALREQVRTLRAACEAAEKLLDGVMSFYGTGLEVAGWHMNGDLESWDTFFDDNGTGDELTQLRAALAATTEQSK